MSSIALQHQKLIFAQAYAHSKHKKTILLTRLMHIAGKMNFIWDAYL
jgi:hypothetical protein